MEADVSVVIPVHDREHTLRRAVESVLAQSVAPREVLIVDDRSTDGSRIVADRLAEENPSVRALNSDGRGANAARNYGVKRAASRWIAFQDSDDEWHPDKLARQLAVAEETRAEFVACGFYRHSKGAPVTPVPADAWEHGKTSFQEALARGNFISTQTVLVSRDLVLREPFDEELGRFQDWELWIRLSGLVDIRTMADLLVDVHETDGNISSRQELVGPALQRILEKHDSFFRQHRDARRRLIWTCAGGYRRSGCWSKAAARYMEWLLA